MSQIPQNPTARATSVLPTIVTVGDWKYEITKIKGKVVVFRWPSDSTQYGNGAPEEITYYGDAPIQVQTLARALA